MKQKTFICSDCGMEIVTTDNRNVGEHDVKTKMTITADDLIACERKMLGRNITRFFCVDCFCDYMGDGFDWFDVHRKIQDFKEEGCALFQ